MTKILMTALVTLSSCFALAGEVRPATAQQTGINESVTIQNLGTNWGYTFQMHGFYFGTGVMNLVPVTREAAQVLQSLNKESRYNCIIENSTFIAEKNQTQTIGGTYFVLDINCD